MQWTKTKKDTMKAILVDDTVYELLKGLRFSEVGGMPALVVDRKPNRMSPQKKGVTGLRGVTTQKSGSFIARFYKDGRAETLGSFATAEEAARAYDKRSLEVWGKNAKLNYPIEENECSQ